MGSWVYEWNDGTVSLISASSKEEARRLLDELDEADEDQLKPVKDGFFVTFKPKPHPDPEEPQWACDIGESSESIFGPLNDVEDRRAKEGAKEAPTTE